MTRTDALIHLAAAQVAANVPGRVHKLTPGGIADAALRQLAELEASAAINADPLRFSGTQQDFLHQFEALANKLCSRVGLESGDLGHDGEPVEPDLFPESFGGADVPKYEDLRDWTDDELLRRIRLESRSEQRARVVQEKLRREIERRAEAAPHGPTGDA